MANFALNGYRPRVGDRVGGMSGSRYVEGYVLEHPRYKHRAWVFSTPHGCVLCYITVGNRRIAINEIRKL